MLIVGDGAAVLERTSTITGHRQKEKWFGECWRGILHFTTSSTAWYIPLTSPEGFFFYFFVIASVLCLLGLCCVITVMCPVAHTGHKVQLKHTTAAAAA